MDPTADSDDMHASNFWTANGWQALRAVPWEEFVSAYESYVEQVETLLVDEVQRLHHHLSVRAILRYTLARDEAELEAGAVSLKSFSRFLARFGPFTDALRKAASVFQRGVLAPWFPGAIDRALAARRLAAAPAPSYLLRYSSQEGHFALSTAVEERGRLVTRNVLLRNEAQAGGGFILDPGGPQEVRFESFAAFFSEMELARALGRAARCPEHEESLAERRRRAQEEERREAEQRAGATSYAFHNGAAQQYSAFNAYDFATGAHPYSYFEEAEQQPSAARLEALEAARAALERLRARAGAAALTDAQLAGAAGAAGALEGASEEMMRLLREADDLPSAEDLQASSPSFRQLNEYLWEVKDLRRTVLCARGSCLKALGRAEEARSCWEAAEVVVMEMQKMVQSIREQVIGSTMIDGDPDDWLSDSMRSFHSDLDRAKLGYFLTAASIATADWDAALAYYSSALGITDSHLVQALRKKLAEHLAEHPQLRAALEELGGCEALLQEGKAAMAAGRLPEALSLFKRCVEAARLHGELETEARALFNMASVHHAGWGNAAAALEHLETSCAVWRRIYRSDRKAKKFLRRVLHHATLRAVECDHIGRAETTFSELRMLGFRGMHERSFRKLRQTIETRKRQLRQR